MLADQQLKASLKEIDDLKAALDEHAIVAITDAQGKITCVNDKFCAISKYDREELLGQDHRLINSGHHSKKFIRELWTTVAHGRVWKGEIKNRAKDGTFYWVDTTIVPFLNADGQPRQYIAIRADITQRKAVEEQLRDSLKEVGDLKSALDEHAIVAITDAKGKITYVNDKFCAISKYAREELLGQDHRLINSGHHPQAFIRELWTTIGQGWTWKGEIKNRAKDGSFYWVDTTIVPFLDADGKPLHYIAIRADITKRKAAEAKIQQMNVELEQRVAERTAELKRSNLELEQFAYVASHDMREPLRAVSGFSQILKRNCSDKLTPHEDEMIGHIVDGAKRMADIIDDLLALSRIGSQPHQFEMMEIAKPLERALENLSVTIRERRALILHDALPTLPVDGSQLALLFQNLIGNAIKFCGERTPEIHLGAAREGDGFWTISVRDNGIGIEPKYFERIFGIFQRLHTRDEYPGTGIGLAICKKIVERHGGKIWLASAAGNGTTFYFTLPEGQKNGKPATS